MYVAQFGNANNVLFGRDKGTSCNLFLLHPRREALPPKHFLICIIIIAVANREKTQKWSKTILKLQSCTDISTSSLSLNKTKKKNKNKNKANNLLSSHSLPLSHIHLPTPCTPFKLFLICHKFLHELVAEPETVYARTIPFVRTNVLFWIAQTTTATKLHDFRFFFFLLFLSKNAKNAVSDSNRT